VSATRLADLLDERAARTPDAPALTWQDRTWSYRWLREASVAAAGWLRARRVRRGDRVLTLAGNQPQVVVLAYAASRVGAIHSILNDQIRRFHLEHILADCAPRLVLSSAAAGELVRAIDGAPVYGLEELPTRSEAPGAGRGAKDPGIEALATDPAALIYTSGSTAMPKAVVCPHRQMLFAARAIQHRLGYRPDDSIFCCLPLSFDYGLYQAFLACLSGARLVLGTGPDAGPPLLNRLLDERITVFPLVPSLAVTLGRLLQRTGQPLARLRLVTSTGAALSPVAAEQLREYRPDLSVVPMYGLTECKRVAIEEPNAHLHRPGSVGMALPGTSARVVDPAGRPLPAGQVGELVVSGPHVMSGYWQAPALTARRFRRDDGGRVVLHTGDQCRMDAAGRIYFIGRDDDIYKQRGLRVSAPEVEAAALDVPGVTLAAAVPPGRSVPRSRLFVTGAVTADQVRAGLAARLETGKVPDEVHVVPSLPLTVTGKIDKRALDGTVAPAGLSSAAPAGLSSARRAPTAARP
jgi:acyl-CoA synthetase (AMP-forming)/AMP-acid ligase II